MVLNVTGRSDVLGSQLGRDDYATLTIEPELTPELLDRVRPPAEPETLPNLDWLTRMTASPLEALTRFVEGWIPETDQDLGDFAAAPWDVPEPFAVFYRLARHRPTLLGVQNRLRPPHAWREAHVGPASPLWGLDPRPRLAPTRPAPRCGRGSRAWAPGRARPRSSRTCCPTPPSRRRRRPWSARRPSWARATRRSPTRGDRCLRRRPSARSSRPRRWFVRTGRRRVVRSCRRSGAMRYAPVHPGSGTPTWASGFRGSGWAGRSRGVSWDRRR
jgi:hypothetical protein